MSDATQTKRRRAAVTNFAGSTATTLVASVQAVVLMPLYLHHIGPKLLGGWLATGELLVLMLAFDMGIPNLMIQRIGASLATGDRRQIGAYFGTGAAVLLTFSALLGFALIGASPFVAGWVGITGAEAEQLRGAFLLGAAATCGMLVNYIFQGLARGMQEPAVVNVGGFVGVVAGFVVTTAMLLGGYGLWSIGAGLLVRSGCGILGNAYYLFFRLDREVRRSIRIDLQVGREFWRLSPPLFASGVAYTLMKNSQVLLAAVVLGPESAAIFGLTRKAADLIGTVLDAVGYSAYGGFANLFASGNRLRSRSVYREIIAVYLAIGIALMCAYVAVNPSLVAVWAGPKMFGGSLLTVSLAVAMLASGWSYLSLCLYRATDHHRQVSAALLLECACRVPAMYVGLRLLGLPGLAVGAMSTALVSGTWAHLRIAKLLPSSEHVGELRVWMTRLAVFSAAIATCLAIVRPNWAFVVLVGACSAASAGLIFVWIDPLLSRVRSSLSARFARVGP